MLLRLLRVLLLLLLLRAAEHVRPQLLLQLRQLRQVLLVVVVVVLRRCCGRVHVRLLVRPVRLEVLLVLCWRLCVLSVLRMLLRRQLWIQVV